MSIANALRSGVAAMRQALGAGGMLVDVQRKPYLGIGQNGRDTYGPAETVPDVLWEDVDARVVTFEGAESVVRAKLTILAPFVVSAKDRWVLPDGREMAGKIVRPGVVPEDGERITTEVLLG